MISKVFTPSAHKILRDTAQNLRLLEPSLHRCQHNNFKDLTYKFQSFTLYEAFDVFKMFNLPKILFFQNLTVKPSLLKPLRNFKTNSLAFFSTIRHLSCNNVSPSYSASPLNWDQPFIGTHTTNKHTFRFDTFNLKEMLDLYF